MTRLLALMVTAAVANPVPAAEPDAARLAGTWLFDAASREKGDALAWVWTSTLTIQGDRFTLSGLAGSRKALAGTFALGPPATPRTIALTLDEFDLSESGAPVKIPAGTLPGIVRFDADRPTVCFAQRVGGPRPTAFEAGDGTILLRLARAPDGFQGFPKEVTVRVLDQTGQPAANVAVAPFLTAARPKAGAPKAAAREWQYAGSVKTGADGRAVAKYETLRGSPVVARDPDRELMGIASPSPSDLARGEVSVRLAPEVRMTGTLVSEELKQAGQSISWTNVYAMRDGRRFASSSSQDGRFEFVLPPGPYTLHAYGTDLRMRQVPVTVPADRSEFATGPIPLTASRLVVLRGKPAPELDGVVGWKGGPVRLADLKGKYVLLEFWGYWCGPCVESMQVLFELHEKFAGKGLAVVGVHLDADGEVDTAAKLDDKIAGFQTGVWKGKDLPFPVALTSGKPVGQGDDRQRGGAAAQYGVLSYPTAILIDREGTVVGAFGARDAKHAVEQMEKLLADMK